MIDTTAIERWLEAYLHAWSTDAPADIAALFAADATYLATPYGTPHVGVDAIVQWWVRQANAQVEWSFEHDIVAREGDTYVVRGVTRYPAGLESDAEKVYHNIWLVTLDDDGRASAFVEYWMLQR